MAGPDDGYAREASWTGSENQRRPQGGCPEPYRSRDQTPRFFVPAGSPVEVRKITGDRWRKHTTVRENGFERFERYDGSDHSYEFRADGGWLMRVKAWLVQQR